MITEPKKLKKTREKVNSFRYLVTKFNDEGWAESAKACPVPFDLVTVETKTGKRLPAWWAENAWEGYRLKNSDEVLRWKRRLYEHIT